MSRTQHPSLLRRQHGAAALEFAVAAPAVLLAGLVVIETAHWHLTRQAVSLALMEAARTGSVAHAHPARMNTAFSHALQPLTRRPPPWRIDVLSPDDAAFIAHADSRLRVPGAKGRPTINHNYQALQHGQRPQAPDIFQANTLVLRLHYEHRPLAPMTAALLRALGRIDGDEQAQALAAGRLPIVRHVALPMQSHPVQWTVRATARALNPIPSPASPDYPAAVGDLSERPPAQGEYSLKQPAFPSDLQAGNLPPFPRRTPAGIQIIDPLHTGSDRDGELCGIALCCAPGITPSASTS